MKKILLLFLILSVSVFTTACINNLAIQELNNKAVNYMDKGDAETAICRLKSSLDLDSDIYQTHYNLAIAYNSLGQYEDAVSELETVLKLKPDFNDVYYTLGVAKEAIAYNIINNEGFGIDSANLSSEQIDNFVKIAKESVNAYETYIKNVNNSQDSENVKNKIEEINTKIFEYVPNDSGVTNKAE